MVGTSKSWAGMAPRAGAAKAMAADDCFAMWAKKTDKDLE